MDDDLFPDLEHDPQKGEYQDKAWKPKHHYRTGDPDTSADAAADMEDVAAQQIAMIYAVFKQNPDGLNSEQVSKILYGKLDYQQVLKRVSDLKNSREIHDSGERRKNTRSNKMAIVWKVGPPPIEEEAV